MYFADITGAQLLLGYSDLFSGEVPDLKAEIEHLNIHKTVSIICELIRVRDAMLEPVKVMYGEIRIPFETVLKRDMCGINPRSAEELFTNPIMRKDVHIISLQMLLLLLKKILQFGNVQTLGETDYEITQDDYKKIIQLQLVVADELNKRHSENIDLDHFIYSTYHLNYQRNVANEFTRMYYMLEIISKSKENFDEDVQREYKDYYHDFKDKYGFTPTQYSFLLFWELRIYYSGVNGLIYNSMWQDLEVVYGKTKVKQLSSEVMGVLSKNLDGYKEWAIESADQEWDFSAFYSNPFILDTAGKYISICDITLRNGFFEKIFWLIRDCYPDDSRAMAFFGRLFEMYIQDLTKVVSRENYDFIEEFEYEDGRNKKKSSDAYIKKGTDLLAVEMKGFSVLLNCMTKNEDIEKNNDKLFVKPILQAYKCLATVLSEKTEFAGVEEVYIISVTMDNINAVPNYFESIHKQIRDEKTVDKVKYYFNLNIEEYEMLMALIENKEDIFALLKEYFCRSKLKPFGTYVLDLYPGITMCSFMEKYYTEASEEMKKMYDI